MVVPKGVQQVPSSPSSRVNSPPQQLMKQQQHQQLLPASSSPPPHHQNHHHHHHPPALLNNDVGGGDPRGLKSQTQQTRVAMRGHQQQDQLSEQALEPDKRKVHNQIEKKYRTSINDRICTLREIVYKHSKDSKRLQKSAVLQKTLDYIYYLEGQSKRLRQENAQLRNAISKLTGGTVRLASPVPDSHTSPLSSESGDDSGHPSSPEECLDDFPPANLCSNEHHSQQQKLQQQQHQQKDIKSNAGGAGAGGRQGFLSGISLGGTSSDNGRPSATSQLFLCTMLVAVLFVSPLSLLPSSSLHSRGGGIDVVHGGGRTLSSFGAASGEEEAGLLGVLAVYLLWCVRLLVAGACFGLVMLRSLPKVSANSKKAVDFRRHKNQAFNELKKGDLMRASDNLILSLSDIGRPIPTSYYGLVTGALWSYLTHLLFQLYVGRCAVALVGLCVKRPSFHIRLDGGKKYHYGVTAADVADTYHLLLQINMRSHGGANLSGMSLFFGLNALNFAEMDRPFGFLESSQIAEMYFCLGLQCNYSLRYCSQPFMWYYLHCSRREGVSPPIRWTSTHQGRQFLMGTSWASELKRSSNRTTNSLAALPVYMLTQLFCKELLRDSFTELLLPECSSAGNGGGGEGEDGNSQQTALRAFRYVHSLASGSQASLLGRHGSQTLKTAAEFSEQGFELIQWWASIGIVACYWSVGEYSTAEEYYTTIESGGDTESVMGVLRQTFKATRLHQRTSCPSPYPSPRSLRHQHNRVQPDHLLPMCAVTSKSLQTCVRAALQNNLNQSACDSELNQLGLLLSCDWLLNLRTSIWEQKGKEESVRKEVANGFKKDMESLAHIITLLPSASSRLQLYKSYQRSIEGANPLHTQVLLSTTGLPVLRKRGQGKELLTAGDSLALQSPEHAMAKVFAYKHLPPALEVPGSVGGDMLMTHCHKTGQPLVERPTALPSPSALASSSNSASSRSSVSSSSLSISRLPASINSTSATASSFTAAASAKQTSV